MGGIDTYLIHNIEYVFMLYSKKRALEKIEVLFEFFEQAIKEKKISSYGISSWAGFGENKTHKSILKCIIS